MSQSDIIEFFEKYPDEVFTRMEVFKGKYSRIYGDITGLKKIVNLTTFYQNFRKAQSFLNSDNKEKVFWRKNELD